MRDRRTSEAHIITEHHAEHGEAGSQQVPGCRCGWQGEVLEHPPWHPIPGVADTLHAAHVVSKLTDAGYSVVPTPRVIHNQEEFHELPVRTWLRDSAGWVCQIGDAAESDPEWMAYPATVVWAPDAAEGEKP